MESKAILATVVAFVCVSSFQPASADDLEWFTAANNGDQIPGTTDKAFNSYNQPAVNNDGVVVFRARSRGGQGQPEHGIYVRDLVEYGAIQVVFRRNGLVPPPTNPSESGKPPTFNEFPSVPRIDAGSDTIATRGQSTPVWFDQVLGEIGTAGVYMNPGGVPTTGAAMLGHLPGFEYYQVPIAEVPPGTRFDQFPGSPSVTERTTVVFKGNFTVDTEGKTGIFYRDVVRDGGLAPVEVVASSYTLIPGSTTETSFGSTAPPSADGKYVVFAGYDDEGSPTEGGIYRARLGNKPIVLETVVKIGDPVPGETEEGFTEFGEAVSLASNGRHVLFWGAWDEHEKREIDLVCPNEGNKLRYDFCLSETASSPHGYVHVHQGIFLKDMQHGTITTIAKTGDVVDDTNIQDFAYWNFSGRVPGMESDDIEETARWRTATFGAVSGHGIPNRVAFKARTTDGTDAIYVRDIRASRLGDVMKLVWTGMPGKYIDPDAPPGAVVSSIGLERDGFRGDWLALTASMLVPPVEASAASGEGSSEVTGWAGIYAAHFLDDDEVAPY